MILPPVLPTHFALVELGQVSKEVCTLKGKCNDAGLWLFTQLPNAERTNTYTLIDTNRPCTYSYLSSQDCSGAAIDLYGQVTQALPTSHVTRPNKKHHSLPIKYCTSKLSASPRNVLCTAKNCLKYSSKFYHGIGIRLKRARPCPTLYM
jgi:hypothetical protein